MNGAGALGMTGSGLPGLNLYNSMYNLGPMRYALPGLL